MILNRFIVGLLLCLLMIKAVLAGSDIEFKGGLSLLKFGYQEFNTDNSIMDEESGYLPGIFLGATYHQPDWYAELDFTYYDGNVTYSGYTQSTIAAYDGIAITSKTNTAIADTTLLFGRPLITSAHHEYVVYTGIGYYRWRRNIQSSTTSDGLRVAGILEFYSWIYGVAGIKLPLIETPTSKFQMDFRLTRMLQAQLDVDYLGYSGFDGITLDLDEKWGYQIRFPWTVRFNSDAVITFEPYYTVWNIGRSNVKSLTRAGVATNSTAVEPRSETRNLGIFVYFNYSL